MWPPQPLRWARPRRRQNGTSGLNIPGCLKTASFYSPHSDRNSGYLGRVRRGYLQRYWRSSSIRLWGPAIPYVSETENEPAAIQRGNSASVAGTFTGGDIYSFALC